MIASFKKIIPLLFAAILITLSFCSCAEPNITPTETPTPTPTPTKVIKMGAFPDLTFDEVVGNVLTAKTLNISPDYSVELRSDNSFYFNTVTKEHNFENGNRLLCLFFEESVLNYDKYISPKIAKGYKVLGILIYASCPYFVLQSADNLLIMRIVSETLEVTYKEFCFMVERYQTSAEPRPSGGFALKY